MYVDIQAFRVLVYHTLGDIEATGGMKDLAAALQEELNRQKKEPAEVQELFLDNKCKTANLEVG